MRRSFKKRTDIRYSTATHTWLQSIDFTGNTTGEWLFIIVISNVSKLTILYWVYNIFADQKRILKFL